MTPTLEAYVLFLTLSRKIQNSVPGGWAALPQSVTQEPMLLPSWADDLQVGTHIYTKSASAAEERAWRLLGGEVLCAGLSPTTGYLTSTHIHWLELHQFPGHMPRSAGIL